MTSFGRGRQRRRFVGLLYRLVKRVNDVDVESRASLAPPTLRLAGVTIWVQKPNGHRWADDTLATRCRGSLFRKLPSGFQAPLVDIPPFDDVNTGN